MHLVRRLFAFVVLAQLGCIRESPVREPDAPSVEAVASVQTMPALSAATTPLVASSEGWLEDRSCALSCHTTVPFVIASAHLGPEAAATREAILERVAGRVQNWDAASPWYGGTSEKVAQSRGTESVLNALALATHDHPEAPRAIEHLARSQRSDGGWDWLDFGLAPWEDGEAEVAGAALAAVALARVDDPPGQAVAGVRRYLGAQLDRRRRPLHSTLAVLWAEATLGQVLPCKLPVSPVKAVLDAQRRDGSWNRDPYLTALATYVLSQYFDGASHETVAKGRAWLREHQDNDGSWSGRSPNRRDPFNDQLATDAATAFAVLALEGS